MTHKNIINTMIHYAASAKRFRLHGDIIESELEKEYRTMTGEDIIVNRLDGGNVYQVGTAKFYTGALTRHPSTRSLDVIAA